jgi:DnaK suppressor protein
VRPASTGVPVRNHRVAGEVPSSNARQSAANQSFRPGEIHNVERTKPFYNMTKTELNTFRRTLEHKQAELANGNRNREALAIETSPDELDRIQHASARDNAMNNLERTSERLREVRSALRRINAGTFGTCAACEESIHSKRLDAVPWALYCIVCQNDADREQKTPRGEFDVSLAMTA